MREGGSEGGREGRRYREMEGGRERGPARRGRGGGRERESKIERIYRYCPESRVKATSTAAVIGLNQRLLSRGSP